MRVNWEEITDKEAYVKKTLRVEASDIPMEKINAAEWREEEVRLSRLKIDRLLIEDQDKVMLHNQRRDKFMEAIRRGEAIKPLIALGRERFLVDGYARYRACVKMGIERARVVFQEFGEERGK